MTSQDPFTDQVQVQDSAQPATQDMYSMFKQLVADGDQLQALALECGVGVEAEASFRYSASTNAGVQFATRPLNIDEVVSKSLSELEMIHVTMYEAALMRVMINEGWEPEQRKDFLNDVRKEHRG